MAYGTLIGAVRHKGYIPWDDDIDIMMPRSDYNRLIQIFNGKYQHLTVIAPELNPNYYAPYANVYNNLTILEESGISHGTQKIGVKIDIFPMDFVPNDVESYKEQISKTIRINEKMLIKRRSLFSVLKRNFYVGIKLLIKKLLLVGYPYSKMQKEILTLSKLSSDSDFVDNVVFPFFDAHMTRIPKDLLTDFCKVEFEGYELQAISNYDQYLSLQYGDYMTLPPEEKRVPGHGFDAYWL